MVGAIVGIGIYVGYGLVFVLGVCFLSTGKIKLPSSKVVEGGMARLIGVILLVLPPIFGCGGVFVYENSKTTGRGQLDGGIIIAFVAGSGVPLLVAIVLTLVSAKPLKKKSIRDNREDDEDRSRRRGENEDNPDRDDPRIKSKE